MAEAADTVSRSPAPSPRPASTTRAPLADFDLRTPAFRADPTPFYERLRREMPIARLRRARRGDALYAARYDDVMVLMKDTARFANDKRNAGRRVSWIESKMSMGITEAVVMRDDEDHRRLRDLAHKAFTPMRVAALEERIVAIAHRLLDEAEARGRFELIADLALPLPIAVISHMMGVDERYHGHFHEWMSGIIELDGAGPIDLIANIPSLFKLNGFLRELIADRRRTRGDDLLSALIDAEESGDKLSFDELVATTLVLLLAGHETTVNLIGNGTLALVDHPNELARLRADPALMDTAVEEMLRFTSPVQINAPRFAREDTELSGVFIAKGTAIAPLLGSANHDEGHFVEPARFDVGRSPNRHVTFGYGKHFCLGAPLARLEAKAVFRVLLERYGHIALAAPRDTLGWRRSLSVRGLLALPLTVTR